VTPGTLLGRSRLVANVQALLYTGRSVLLVGPHGSGKTAIIDVVRRPGLVVVDPLVRITTPRAAALRRALDRGAVVLGAACTLDRAEMGHVGRVVWRLEPVYLRPLDRRSIVRIIEARLRGDTGAPAVDRAWMREAVEVAAGVPGRAVALASAAATHWREREVILPPRLALVVAWQDGVTGQFGSFNTAGHRPGEPSS